MRSFYEAWSRYLTVRPTALGEIRHLASDEFGMRSDQDVDERVLSKGLVANIEKTIGQLSQYLSVLDATERKPYENPSIGLLLCEQMSKPVVQLTVQGYSQPIGIATYQVLNKIPEPYKTLAPVIDGVRRLLVEEKNAEKKAAKKGRRK